MKVSAVLVVAAVMLVGTLGVARTVWSGSPVFIPQVPTRTVNPGHPPNFDPRFGNISSRPTFEAQPPVHPSFRAQPIIIAPGAPTPVEVPPSAQFVCVPGRWWWSGAHWVWYPGFCTR